MDFGSKGKGERISTILQILNLADGKLNLLEIANIKKFKLINHITTINDLLKSGYIKKLTKRFFNQMNDQEIFQIIFQILMRVLKIMIINLKVIFG